MFMDKILNYDNDTRKAGLIRSVHYLSPVEPLPERSDYPLSLLTPILARHISSDDADFIENIPHKHMEFELIYVMEGSVTIQFDKSMIHVVAGDGVCIKRGIVHSIESDEGKFKLEVVHFHHAILFGPTINILGGRNLIGLIKNEDFVYVKFDHDTEDGNKVIDRIHNIYEQMHSSKAGSELLAIGSLYEIWGLGLMNMTQVNEVPLTKQQSLDNWRIEQATEYIAAHYTDDILLSDIAKVCEVSESECCRTFKRCLKSSPIDYINRYRVYAAAEILTNDLHNTPMSDIAMMVGFNYASYFNKTFKRYIGMTPMQYRKKFNKSASIRKDQQEFRI